MSLVLLFTPANQVFCLYRPREPQGIIACCNPVPPLVRQQVNELHLLVQQAREMPLLKVREDGWQQCFLWCNINVMSLVNEGT